MQSRCQIAYLSGEVEACDIDRSFWVTLGALNVHLEERDAIRRPHGDLASVREAESK